VLLHVNSQCHSLTPHPAGNMAVPPAGLKALKLSLTSGSGSQSFESCEATKKRFQRLLAKESHITEATL